MPEPTKNQKFFLTFGYASPYKDKYVEVHAESEHEAKEVAYNAHGNKWSMIYPEAHFAQQVKDYGYTCLCVIMPNERNNFRASPFQGTFDTGMEMDKGDW